MTTPDTKSIRANATSWPLPAGIADDILALCDAYEYSRLEVTHANNHADTAISDMQELRAENERLRAALAPFLKAAELFPEPPGTVKFDISIYCPAAGPEFELRGDDLRRARDAIAQKGEE